MPNYSLNSEMGLSDDPLFIKYKLYIKKISFKRPNTHLSLAYKQLVYKYFTCGFWQYHCKTHTNMFSCDNDILRG